MLRTTIAGSLPKPGWLAETEKLWPAWRLEGKALEEAKQDAILSALKMQESAGIDIVTDGEMPRQHFVHGFLEKVSGIDFQNRQTIGIRNDRYKAVALGDMLCRIAGRRRSLVARLGGANGEIPACVLFGPNREY